MRKPYERSDRSDLIRAVREDGETVTTAATRLGIPMSTAYRWMRQAPSETAMPTFVEVVPERTEGRGLRVCVGRAEIEVRAGFLLRRAFGGENRLEASKRFGGRLVLGFVARLKCEESKRCLERWMRGPVACRHPIHAGPRALEGHLGSIEDVASRSGQAMATIAFGTVISPASCRRHAVAVGGLMRVCGCTCPTALPGWRRGGPRRVGLASVSLVAGYLALGRMAWAPCGRPTSA